MILFYERNRIWKTFGWSESGHVPCCNEIYNAFDENFIRFGHPDDYDNCDINITSKRCYPEGCFMDVLRITHCPFCRKKIIVLRKEENAKFFEIMKEKIRK
jgi:hypothetical protein